MSTFSHFRSAEPRSEIINNPILIDLAKKHNKSVVQIVLRWLIQQNIIIIPKTWDKIHLKENISIFDFELSKEEMNTIDSMDKGKFLNYNPLSAQEGLPKKYRNWIGFKEWNDYYKPEGLSYYLHKIFR